MPYQNHIKPIYGAPPFQKLDFGLCARVFSAVFLPLEPTIPFFNWSAVSPSKSRDFRLPEPTIPFFRWSAVSPSKSRDFRLPEPVIPFTTGQRFPKSRDFPEPAIPFYPWSAVSPNHVTSGEPAIPFYPWSAVSPNHVTSGEPTIPFYYWSAVSHHHVTSDVTRPIRSQHWEPSERHLLLISMGDCTYSKGVYIIHQDMQTCSNKLPVLIVMQGSILPVTIPPGCTLGDLQFFPFLAVYSPPPGRQKETIPHPQDSSSTTNTLFCVQNIGNHIDFCTKAKADVLTRT